MPQVNIIYPKHPNAISSFKPKYLYTQLIPELQHKMKFTKLFSLFTFVALAVLAVNFASAQTTNPDGCLNITASSFPTSVSQSAGSFQVNFTLSNGVSSSLCSTRTFNSATIASNIGLWSALNNIPSSLTNVSSASLSGVLTYPNNATGPITTTLTLNVNSTSQNNQIYAFTLPTVFISSINSPSSSNLSITVPTSPTQAGRNATISINNFGTTILSAIQLSEITANPFGVTFTPSQIVSLLNGTSQTVQVMLNSLNNLNFGINTVQVSAQTSGQNATGNVQFKKSFCSAGPVLGNLSISSIDWTNEGEGDDNNWELLDEIELEVEIENNNDDDEVDAVIKLGLFDQNGQNNADDLIFLEDSDGEEEEIQVTIDEDDDTIVKYKFKVPADLDAGNYKLAVKVYDDDDGENHDCDDTSSDFNNEFFHTIEVEQTSDEERFVIVDEIESNSPLSCGESLTGQFKVFNVGNEDQNRVRITMINSALGINKEFELTEDLDQGEDKIVDFNIPIATGVENKFYTISFRTYYDYRNGVYREESEKEFIVPVEVVGCASNLGSSGNPNGLTNTVISAELISEAIAGKQLTVKATITNTGTESKTYTISAENYGAWAELGEISESSFTLAPGENKEVNMNFNINSKTIGPQTFDLNVESNGRVQVQEVEVNIEGKKSSIFNFGGSPTIWIIGLVNLVLIVLIILVAVRLAKR